MHHLLFALLVMHYLGSPSSPHHALKYLCISSTYSLMNYTYALPASPITQLCITLVCLVMHTYALPASPDSRTYASLRFTQWCITQALPIGTHLCICSTYLVMHYLRSPSLPWFTQSCITQIYLVMHYLRSPSLPRFTQLCITQDYLVMHYPGSSNWYVPSHAILTLSQPPLMHHSELPSDALPRLFQLVRTYALVVCT
jgi:hypothetical protein